jgi:hypothetical protein
MQSGVLDFLQCLGGLRELAESHERVGLVAADERAALGAGGVTGA